ncbi:MAG: DUF971 domain-containing protein [Chromatiaceae bacterium]|nr:DUF971 domain-containing protein [Chromatiaceae bacterium]MCP5443757.1 DUF971 domain-containing protein [Chromatiaceae bacterium]
MSDHSPEKIPVEISLHQKSRLLVVAFQDGQRFELPCEYLRVFSKAKEVRTMNTPVTGKEQVNITSIEPQGQYAVRLIFDDGHDTGIYSWSTLYDLGQRYRENWNGYLEKLTNMGFSRQSDVAAPEFKRIRMLYFTYLVKKLRRESEELQLPATISDVRNLVDWLRKRDPNLAHLYRDGSIRITINKQFSEPFTRIDDGDEVALIPTSPIAPVAD